MPAPFGPRTDSRFWPIATGDALTASRRFRGIADLAGPASSPGPVASDTREPQDGTFKKGACAGPGSAQLFLISRPPALILIAAPFSSRLSRYTVLERREGSVCPAWIRRGTTAISAKLPLRKANLNVDEERCRPFLVPHATLSDAPIVVMRISGLPNIAKIAYFQASSGSGFPGSYRAERRSRWVRRMEIKYGGNHVCAGWQDHTSRTK